MKKKKLKIRKPASKDWTKAALPGGEIPEISEALSVVMKGSSAIPLVKKEESLLVPTCLPGLNRALRIGGMPMSSICAVHGASKSGKTALCLALARSFQLQSHIVVFIDAEHSLDRSFAANCGVDLNQLQYLGPRTFEQATKEVEGIINNFEVARKKRKIGKDVCLLLVVDSLNKLCPEDELKEISKVGKAFPLRALMSTTWLDRLTPIVGSLPILFVGLAHEKTVMDAKPFQQQYRVKGSSALIYDSTIVIRVTTAGKVKVNKQEVAIVHKGTIEKSKVSSNRETFGFTMGKGVLDYVLGLDYPATLIEEMKHRGKASPVKKDGKNWYHEDLPDGCIYGERNFLLHLREHPDLVDRLTEELNATATDCVVSEYEYEEIDA
jgi:hypothetical protein